MWQVCSCQDRLHQQKKIFFVCGISNFLWIFSIVFVVCRCWGPDQCMAKLKTNSHFLSMCVITPGFSCNACAFLGFLGLTVSFISFSTLLGHLILNNLGKRIFIKHDMFKQHELKTLFYQENIWDTVTAKHMGNEFSINQQIIIANIQTVRVQRVRKPTFYF